MQDTTVSGLRYASDSAGNAGRRFFGRADFPANEDELITFWADDQIAMPRCRLPEH